MHKCWCKCKTCHICEKYYIWNPATCSCKIGKSLASIMGDSVKQELIQQILMKREQLVKQKISKFYLHLY